MTIHYLFKKTTASTSPYSDYLKDLLKEAELSKCDSLKEKNRIKITNGPIKIALTF